MRPNALRELLNQGKPAYGTMIQDVRSPSIRTPASQFANNHLVWYSIYALTLRAYNERLPAEEKVARSNRVEGARLADSRWCAPVPQWDRGAVYETEG